MACCWDCFHGHYVHSVPEPLCCEDLTRDGVANGLRWETGDGLELHAWEPALADVSRWSIIEPPRPAPDGDQILTSPAFTPIRDDEPLWPTTTAGVALRNLYVTRGERALLELALWNAWLFDQPLM